MIVRPTHALVLATSLGALLGCKSSPLHADGATDGSASDGSRCTGSPIDCVQGGPLGGGVACGDFGMPASCVGGQWTCPSGMVSARDCTCGSPGLACGEICTSHGWVCPDAGTGGDADAHATDSDDSSCIGDAPLLCTQGGDSTGGGVACAEELVSASCIHGSWACNGGPFSIDVHLCTCTSPAPSGCVVCSPRGWVSCNDGGIDAPADSGGTCAFAATYTFYDDGGLRAFFYRTVLSPPRTSTLARVTAAANDGVACPRELSCTSPSAITVPAIEAAVANADVQAALAKPKGMLYGTDPRPADGTVFVFERDDGRGFLVGSGAVPAGLRTLETLLHQLNTETLATPECASL